MIRNSSTSVGMCPPGEWQKLSKGSWTLSTSPFGDRILDIRMNPDLPSSALEVSTEGGNPFGLRDPDLYWESPLMIAICRVLAP